eukprot:gene9056-9807_t
MNSSVIGNYHSRSFSNKDAEKKIERPRSAPPSARTQAQFQANQTRRSQVPWIPNSQSSNRCHNAVMRKHLKERMKVVARSPSPVLKVRDSTSSIPRKPKLHAQSREMLEGDMIVEAFIGGKVSSNLPSTSAKGFRGHSSQSHHTTESVESFFSLGDLPTHEKSRKFTIPNKKQTTKTEYDDLLNQLRLHQEPEKEANEILTSQPSSQEPISETEKPNVIFGSIGEEEKVETSKENDLGNTLTSQLSDLHLSDYNIDKITQLLNSPEDADLTNFLSPVRTKSESHKTESELLSPYIPPPVRSASPPLEISTSPSKPDMGDKSFEGFFSDESNNYDLNDQHIKHTKVIKRSPPTKPLISPQRLTKPTISLQGKPMSNQSRYSSLTNSQDSPQINSGRSHVTFSPQEEKKSSFSFNEKESKPKFKKQLSINTSSPLKPDEDEIIPKATVSIDESFDEFFHDLKNNYNLNDQHPSKLQQGSKTKNFKPKSNQIESNSSRNTLEEEEKYFQTKFGNLDLSEEDESFDDDRGIDGSFDPQSHLENYETVREHTSRSSSPMSVNAITSKLESMKKDLDEWLNRFNEVGNTLLLTNSKALKDLTQANPPKSNITLAPPRKTKR